ncbi:MAG: class I SAM-dependent methyltransferase [Cycloclasticus sp.]
MIIATDKDPIGVALLDFLQSQEDAPIAVTMDIADEDILPPSYFFRSYEECPELEQIALQQSAGKVLDIGAGAGSHSLYLQKEGLDVTAIDVSPHSVEVMRQRGIKKAELIDFYDYQGVSFDTLLLLMNGIGLVQNLDGFERFFTHARTLLSPNGQIILDSSDLIYMFEAEDGSYVIDLSNKYHGEVTFNLSYKDIVGEPFDWLYVAEELLLDAAEANGFNCEIIKQGPHYDYLAKLTMQEQ